jgi:hypothetical protein
MRPQARVLSEYSGSEGAAFFHEGARDLARIGLRKKIEMLFAHLERILKLDRLRRPNVPHDLAATPQNLRKLAKLIPMPNMQLG